MKKVIKHLDEAKKCKDVDSIKHLKVKKIIVSNSYKRAILPILKYYKIKKYFKKIYGADNFFNKASFLKEYLKKNKISGRNCYYIGDRVADIKVARKVGCNGVIITGKCAWDSRKQILENEPDFVVSSIKDLKGLI